MSNRQNNQHFGTLDLIVLVVLCGTVSSVVGASVAGLLHDNRPSRARTMAETLASEIRQQHDIALRLENPNLGESRGPASVSESVVPPLTDGQMGKDPWGNPYFYTVLGRPTSAGNTIVVWSGGPNGRVDSKIGELSEANLSSFHFRGDDVGYIAGRKLAR